LIEKELEDTEELQKKYEDLYTKRHDKHITD